MNQDFLPTASITRLRQRAEIINRVRAFFEKRSFFHVETPILSRDTVVDRFLEPISIERGQVIPGERDAEMFLQTSPEFGMKRLLAAGAQAIYQIGKVFRTAEIGAQHNPEFTMLEWYRVGDGLAEGMRLLAEFASEMFQREPTVLKTYREVFQSAVDLDPQLAPIEKLANVARDRGIDVQGIRITESARDDWLNLILSELIQPTLGLEAPVIVYDWPASQSALAIVRDENPPVAERFELYLDGVELANGYHELVDPDELVLRNQKVNRQRAADGVRVLPSESRLLDAMRNGLPDCAGVAVGIDRLVMVALGVEEISDVIPFPISRA